MVVGEFFRYFKESHKKVLAATAVATVLFTGGNAMFSPSSTREVPDPKSFRYPCDQFGFEIDLSDVKPGQIVKMCISPTGRIITEESRNNPSASPSNPSSFSPAPAPAPSH